MRDNFNIIDKNNKQAFINTAIELKGLNLNEFLPYIMLSFKDDVAIELLEELENKGLLN